MPHRIQRGRSRMPGGFAASAAATARKLAVIPGWRTALAVPALAALPVLPAGPASVGVGISSAPVCLAAAAQPGRSYSLGTVYVVNAGSGSEDISLRAGPPANGLPGRSFPPSWITAGYPRRLWIFSQGSISLSPGRGADIPLTLSVPSDAKPGLYAADLLAGTTAAPAPGSGGQAVFGAGAEDNLQFAVAPARAPSCSPGPAVTPDPRVPASRYGPAPQAAPAPGRGSAIALLAATVLAIAAWRRRRRGGA